MDTQLGFWKVTSTAGQQHKGDSETPPCPSVAVLWLGGGGAGRGWTWTADQERRTQGGAPPSRKVTSFFLPAKFQRPSAPR